MKYFIIEAYDIITNVIKNSLTKEYDGKISTICITRHW